MRPSAHHRVLSPLLTVRADRPRGRWDLEKNELREYEVEGERGTLINQRHEAASSSSQEQPPVSIHIGSSRPHAHDGDAPEFQREDSWAPSGSLRQLEPELTEVLRVESLPRCNIPPATDPERPPERAFDPPGPFTTQELFPEGVVDQLREHREAIRVCIQRALRGTNGWREASRLRPEPKHWSEREAMNECGWGYTWRRKADGLWHAVQPSSHPEVFREQFEDDKPESNSIHVENFLADTERLGMTDRQCASWTAHGFPGAPSLPRHALLGRPHVGALKYAKQLLECQAKDLRAGFVTDGFDLPEFWPCVLDCYNVVEQHGKYRLCIDKTIQLVNGVLTYNDSIVLADDENRVKMVSVRIFSRGIAILQTAGVRVAIAKFDLKAFFRMHGKQRMHLCQSARCMIDGYGTDLRVNFGERDAPDHCGRESNAVCFFVRTELRRLDREYPSKAHTVIKWLAMRMGLAKENGEPDDPDFVWAVYFFFIYYVDDAGLAVIADLLYDRHGEPVYELVTQNDGSIVRQQRRRPDMYFQMSTAIADRYGHGTPEDKRAYPSEWAMEFLGYWVHVLEEMRYMPAWKRDNYKALIEDTRKRPQMPNGTTKLSRSVFKPLVHKLLHAAETYPLGRQRLYYCLKALKALKGEAVFIGEGATAELDWWAEQFELGDTGGVPLASRYSFPATSSDSTVIYYGDSSRELEDPAKVSGFGAWSVIKGVFYYFYGEWSQEELTRFSINVLEAKTRDDGLVAFVEKARSMGCIVTHALGFTDNTSAEFTAERGRTQSDPMHELLLERHRLLQELRVHAATERVTSADNDLADWLSRGDVEEVLRVVHAAGLQAERIFLDPEQRDTSWLPSSALATLA